MDQTLKFRALSEEDRGVLSMLLQRNATQGEAIGMNRDTSFTTDVIDDEEVVSAIKSVPCHY